MPLGQRHEAWCASRVSGREADRDVAESDLAPGIEAVSQVIRQQGSEGIHGIQLVSCSLDLENHGDALHLSAEPFRLVPQVLALVGPGATRTFALTMCTSATT